MHINQNEQTLPHGTKILTYAETIPSWFLLKLKLVELKVIGIRALAPVQNSVSLKLMQRKTLNFVINLPDVENITK